MRMSRPDDACQVAAPDCSVNTPLRAPVVEHFWVAAAAPEHPSALNTACVKPRRDTENSGRKLALTARQERGGPTPVIGDARERAEGAEGAERAEGAEAGTLARTQGCPTKLAACPKASSCKARRDSTGYATSVSGATRERGTTRTRTGQEPARLTGREESLAPRRQCHGHEAPRGVTGRQEPVPPPRRAHGQDGPSATNASRCAPATCDARRDGGYVCWADPVIARRMSSIGALGRRSAVRRPLVSCRVSVSWV